MNFTKNGTYNADVSGNMTIHGITNPVKTKAVITVADSKVSSKAEFTIKLEDYKISGKAIAAGKI